MAKTKQPKSANVTVEFSRTGNAWLDAGIVGLYRMIRGTELAASYLDDGSSDSKKPLTELDRFAEVTADLNHKELVISGERTGVESLLNEAYDRLIECYFSLSSKKQIDEKKAYNFFYNTKTESFETFPKAKPAGAALLLFDKAARPTGGQIKWKDKKNPGVLPASEEYIEIQKKLDEFLAKSELKAGPPAGLLVDGANQVRPKLFRIKLDGSLPADACYLSGGPLLGLGEAKQTSFPLLGGSRGFGNEGKDNPKIGWKIDFVGKFAPAICFFMQQNDDLHLFFPVASSLTQTNKLASQLSPMVEVQENLYRNFEDKLGGFFERRAEVAIAFFHRAFAVLSEKDGHLKKAAKSDESSRAEPKSVEGFDALEDDEAVDPNSIDAGEIAKQVLTEGAISFAIVSASKKGNVWMPKSFWNYTDIVYIARLFQRMQQLEERTDQFGKIVRKVACSPKAFFNSLVDFSAKKDKSLLRDSVCEAILQKRSLLRLIERHAFHINRESSTFNTRVGPMLKFASIYEPERFKGTEMEETYKEMVETATWLGGNIGTSVANAVQKDAGESSGRAKGAIHRLRKTRTIGDFVNELARLQFRYGIDVPKDVMDGSQLSPETFDDFRGFCVVAALNRFLYLMKPKATAESKGN